MIYDGEEQYSEAAVLFQLALQSNLKSIVARLNLGGTLLRLKLYERALTENLEVLESRPNDVLAHVQAGRALSYLRYDDAIAHLNRARELDPKAPSRPGYLLATLYDDLGQDDAAIIEFEEFLKVNPEYPKRDDVVYRIRQICERRISSADASRICSDQRR